MMVTPEQMHQLMDQWEKKGLAADASKPKSGDPLAEKTAAAKAATGSNKSDSPKTAPSQTAGGDKIPSDQFAKKLREMMDSAQSLGNGRYKLPLTPENVEKFQDLLGAMQRQRPCLGRAGLRQIEPGTSPRLRPHRRAGRPQHGRGSLRRPSRRLGNGGPQGRLHRHQGQRGPRQAGLQDRRPRAAGNRGQVQDRARPGAVEGRRQRPRARHLGRRRSAGSGQLADNARP